MSAFGSASPFREFVALVNRLPPVGKNCVVHLVSLEKRFEVPDEKAPDYLTEKMDPNLMRRRLEVGNEQLAGWLQKLNPQDTLKLVAERPPEFTCAKLDSPQAGTKNLGAPLVKEMCESILRAEQGVWRTLLDKMGEVEFTAPFAWKGAPLGQIEVTIFEQGWDSAALTQDQIREISNEAPPIASYARVGVKIEFLGSTPTPLTNDETKRLADWIEFQAREQLLAERTRILPEPQGMPDPQSISSYRSEKTLADLLTERQDVLAKIKEQTASTDKSQPGVVRESKQGLGETPQLKLGTRGFELGVTLQISKSSDITVTLSRRLKLKAGKFRMVSPEPVFNAQGATDTDKVRLVTLKSWKFDSLPEGGGFTEELTGLNSSNSAVAEFHVPLPGKLSEHTASEHQDALAEGRRYLRSGAVALRHGLRGGDRTFSWYHGPFVSNASAEAKLRLPARGPDELLIYNETLGMFDVSYAAAWELGRLTMLEDSHFAMMLFHWKRDHSRTLAHLRQKLDYDFLPLVRQTPDLAPPDSLATWFRSLTLLEDVPFNYLVPDERLLPLESIRFFTVDSMWLECLRDGAFSVGRVLDKDHMEDSARSRDMEHSPRLPGFILRSKVVSDWPQLAVDGYTGVHSEENTLDHEPNPSAPKLTMERFDRLGPNVLLCLFSDPDRAGREIEMVDIHLPAEVLHFGLEEDSGKLTKHLRDPNSGEDLSQCSWISGSEQAGNAEARAYQVDEVTLQNLRIAGVNRAVLEKIKLIAHKIFEGTGEDFVLNVLKGSRENGGAGLTDVELETRMGDNPAETVHQLVLRSSGPFQMESQTIEDIPFRPNGATNVIDLAALFDEVANRLVPFLPPVHRFTAADFSLQMLDSPPLVRFVRPSNKPQVN